MFVAHHLITVDKVFSDKLSDNPPTPQSSPNQLTVAPPSRRRSSGDSGLGLLVPKVKKLGKEAFSDHLEVKKEELCDKLIAAEGLCIEGFHDYVYFELESLND